MLVAKAALPEHATEAFTWSSTFLLAGIALGIATGGVLLESGNSRLVLGAASAAALAGAAGAGLGSRRFHK
jgi:predicted MFS family arabinose efflux permease